MEDLVTESSKILEGLKFMFLGMTTVFSFLILMIGTMNLQSYIIHRFFPEPIPKTDSGSSKKNNSSKIAAITAAIMHHKKVNG